MASDSSAAGVAFLSFVAAFVAAIFAILAFSKTQQLQNEQVVLTNTQSTNQILTYMDGRHGVLDPDGSKCCDSNPCTYDYIVSDVFNSSVETCEYRHATKDTPCDNICLAEGTGMCAHGAKCVGQCNGICPSGNFAECPPLTYLGAVNTTKVASGATCTNAKCEWDLLGNVHVLSAALQGLDFSQFPNDTGYNHFLGALVNTSFTIDGQKLDLIGMRVDTNSERYMSELCLGLIPDDDPTKECLTAHGYAVVETTLVLNEWVYSSWPYSDEGATLNYVDTLGCSYQYACASTIQLVPEDEGVLFEEVYTAGDIYQGYFEEIANGTNVTQV